MAHAGMAVKAALVTVPEGVAEEKGCPTLQEEAQSWLGLQVPALRLQCSANLMRRLLAIAVLSACLVLSAGQADPPGSSTALDASVVPAEPNAGILQP